MPQDKTLEELAEARRMITALESENKELRDSVKTYQQIVENSNSIILRMDTKGKITFFNAYAQRFFGYYENEIIGQNVIGTIVPQTDHAGRDLVAMIEDIGNHPERYSLNENENMRCNGEVVRVLWTNRALLDEEGNVREIICIGNDISHLPKPT